MMKNSSSRKPNIIELAMKYHEVTLAVFIIALVGGVYSLLTMPRSEDPDVTVRQGVLVYIYPGADVQQVEDQLTGRVEEFLFTFDAIKKSKTYSTTKNGQVVVNIELMDHVGQDELDMVWSDINHGLNMFTASLPQGVIGPILNTDFGKTVAVMVAISSERHSYAELLDYAEEVEDAIKTIEETAKIDRFGMQDETMTVSVNSMKMAQYGIGINQVMSVLQQQNSVNYAGEIDGEYDVPIFTSSLYDTQQQLSNQIIAYQPNGNTVRLKDVARVTRGYADTQQKIKIEGEEVVMLSVEMQRGENIVNFGEDLDEKIAEVTATMPSDIHVSKIFSQPTLVAHSINHFMIEFGIAISAVILVVMLLLPLRMATISAIASPVSILVTFGVLNLLGFSIHSVTLAGMIICLGMVVDDAIIIVDNHVEKLDEGLNPWEAAWKAATQLLIPVMTATLTIIFAFIPLAFVMEGISSDFVYTLPYVVSIALATSFFVAIFLTPWLCYKFIKKGIHKKEEQTDSKPSLLTRVQNGYDSLVAFCFRHASLTMAGGALVVVAGVLTFTQVPQQFFPVLDRDLFNLEVWLPTGSSVEATEKVVAQLEEYISEDERIESVSSFIGTSSPRFHSTYAPESPVPYYAQLFIKAKSAGDANELIEEYVRELPNFSPEATIRVKQLSFQASKTPIEVRIIGDNIADLKTVGEQVEEILHQTAGTGWIHTNYQDDYQAVEVNINEERASELGLSNQMITQTLGASLEGAPVSVFWEGDDPVKILLRVDESQRNDYTDVENLYLNTRTGGVVPLRQVASLNPEWQTGQIIRRNGLRTLTVRSEAQKGVFASEMLAEIKPEIEALALPPGVRIAYGGDQEETEENMPNMQKSLIISVMLIFLTLMFQFKSVKRCLVILSTFVLSLLGAACGLLLTGYPFGFTAFLGLISLIGIVVRNGIILVDYADELVRDHGMSIRDAALNAAQRRMRPIFLTSSAAAIGVVPMIVGGSPLWAPLGSVLAVGLMFSMVITLLVVPVLYYLMLTSKRERVEQPRLQRV
jgi:multidrug efflux pump subunit AcrB